MAMVKDLAPANDETAPTLKRVNSKFVKAEAEQTGYVEDSYIGVKGYFLDIWRNNFVSRLTRVVGLRFVRRRRCWYFVRSMKRRSLCINVCVCFCTVKVRLYRDTCWARVQECARS